MSKPAQGQVWNFDRVKEDTCIPCGTDIRLHRQDGGGAWRSADGWYVHPEWFEEGQLISTPQLKTILVEILDRMTCIVAVATLMRADDDRCNRLLRHAGYSDLAPSLVLLLRATSGPATYDPYNWPNRTMHHAHLWLQEHFNEVENGAVIDVEYILGETPEPKGSQL